MRHSSIPTDSTTELQKIKNLINMISRMQNNCIERIKAVDKILNLNNKREKE